MLTVDDGWLAGIIEGEGYIGLTSGCNGRSKRIRIRVKMTDESVVAKVAYLWGATCRADRPGRNAKAHWKPQYVTEVAGLRAESLLDRLRPILSDRRQEQIDTALAQSDRRKKAPLRH
jgi:hypothetical protein